MSEAKKIIITGWSALLKCRVCENHQESKEYGSWEIDSSTIKHCPVCNIITNHTVVGKIAEVMEYEKFKSSLQKISEPLIHSK